MAARMRLVRLGAKKRPFYRVVVIDQRARQSGRYLDLIGTYNPLTDPATITLDEAKALTWLKNGASPSETVVGLLKKKGIWEKHQATKAPKKAASAAVPAV